MTYNAEHGYFAATGTVSDVVLGDHADLCIAEADLDGYKRDNEGNETPVLTWGTTVMDPVELEVRIDHEDLLSVVEELADAKLSELGWERTGDWEAEDNATYAPIARV